MMTNPPNVVAEHLADKLLTAEAALDKAFQCVAELAGYMPVARQSAGVSIAVGHGAMTSVAAVLTSLGEARTNMIEAHGALAKAQRRAGVEERNYGAFVDKPHRSHEQARNLSVVSARQAA